MAQHQIELVRDMSKRLTAAAVPHPTFEAVTKEINFSIFDCLQTRGYVQGDAARFSAGVSALLQTLSNTLLVTGSNAQSYTALQGTPDPVMSSRYASVIPEIVLGTLARLSTAYSDVRTADLDQPVQASLLLQVTTYAVALGLIASAFDDRSPLGDAPLADFHQVADALRGWAQETTIATGVQVA